MRNRDGFIKVFDSKSSDYSALTAAETAYKIIFFPRKDKRLNEEQIKLIQLAVQRDIKIGERMVKFYEWNAGSEAVKLALFIHGHGGKGLDFYKLISSMLNEGGYRVICFDAPASGFSGGDEVDIRDWNACMKVIFKLYGSKFNIVCAHSVGAVSLTQQIRFGRLRAEKICLFGAHAYYDSVVNSALRSLGAASDVYVPLTNLITERFKPIKRGDLWDICSPANNIRAITTTARALHVSEWHIFHGKNDVIYPYTDAELLTDSCGDNARLHLFNCGHKSVLTNLETNREFVKLLQSNSLVRNISEYNMFSALKKPKNSREHAIEQNLNLPKARL